MSGNTYGSAEPDHRAAPDHDPVPAAAGHGTPGHGQDGHDEPLGPIDVRAWAAGLLGVAVGIVIALSFAIPTRLL